MSDLLDRLMARTPTVRYRTYDPSYVKEIESLRQEIQAYEMKKVAGSQKIVQDEWEELIESIQRARNLHGGDRYEFFNQRFSDQNESS